jgi:hypothetical protein
MCWVELAIVTPFLKYVQKQNCCPFQLDWNQWFVNSKKVYVDHFVYPYQNKLSWPIFLRKSWKCHLFYFVSERR